MAKRDNYTSIFPNTSLYTYFTTQQATRDLSLITDASAKRLNSMLIFLLNKALETGKFYGLSESQIEICFQLILKVFIDGKGVYVEDELKEDSFKRFSDFFSNLHSPNEKFIDILTDFFSNIYQHFHLYQWVIDNEQELEITKEELFIETPNDQICKQSLGIPEKEWETQQKRKELDLSYSQKLEKIDSTLNKLNTSEKILDLAEHVPNDTSVSREDFESIAEGVVDSLRESVSGKLVCELDSRSVKLEQTIDLLSLDVSSNVKVKK